MAAEGSPNPRVCILCAGEGSWRCKDCTGKPLLCLHCCREQHQSHPFHRVQHWNRKFFQDAWLYQAGVKLFFGHGGKLCPSKQFLHGKKAGFWEWSGVHEPGKCQEQQEQEQEPEQEPEELEPVQDPEDFLEGVVPDMPVPLEAADFMQTEYDP